MKGTVRRDFQENEQPCNDFQPEDSYEHLLWTHECPVCYGTRVFCKNCCTDHHAGGWEGCSTEAGFKRRYLGQWNETL